MGIFKDNPHLNRYFETTDGQKFYTKNSAELHAKDLKEKEVKEFKRSDADLDTNEGDSEDKRKSVSKMNLTELKEELIKLGIKAEPKTKAEAKGWIKDPSTAPKLVVVPGTEDDSIEGNNSDTDITEEEGDSADEGSDATEGGEESTEETSEATN